MDLIKLIEQINELGFVAESSPAVYFNEYYSESELETEASDEYIWLHEVKRWIYDEFNIYIEIQPDVYNNIKVFNSKLTKIIDKDGVLSTKCISVTYNMTHERGVILYSIEKAIELINETNINNKVIK